jgi:hypothetical protein
MHNRVTIINKINNNSNYPNNNLNNNYKIIYYLNNNIQTLQIISNNKIKTNNKANFNNNKNSKVHTDKIYLQIQIIQNYVGDIRIQNLIKKMNGWV